MLVADHDPATAARHASYVAAVDWCRVSAVVHRGLDTLRHLKTRDVDVVLLDLSLPDVSGLDVLRRLNFGLGSAASPPTTIAVTANGDADVVRTALSLGAADYVVTPLGGSDLIERLDRCRVFRRSLGSGTLNQGQIDNALAALRPRRSLLPKGLSAVTADLVADTLRTAASPLTASVVAGRIGMSRVSARRYLTYFVEHERVGRTCHYGRAGRPEFHYTWLMR